MDPLGEPAAQIDDEDDLYLVDLPAALEFVASLDLEDRDRLVNFVLDTSDDDETIVARHGSELAALIGVDGPALLRWVTLVRPALLERSTYELNECDSSMGGDRNYIVFAGRVVDEGGHMHRELLRRDQRERMLLYRHRLDELVRPLIRLRDRGRARRDRRATSRRTPARAPGRREPDPPPPRPAEAPA